MGLLVVLAIGGVIGWLASLLSDTGERMDVVANVVAGCVGAALGQLGSAALGMRPERPVAAYLASVAGAVVCIVLLHALGVFRDETRLR